MGVSYHILLPQKLDSVYFMDNPIKMDDRMIKNGYLHFKKPPHILIGGLEHEFYFSHHIGDLIIPTDELIFFRGVGQPPTSIYIYIYKQ